MTDIICGKCGKTANQHVFTFSGNDDHCYKTEAQVLRAHIEKLEAAGWAVVQEFEHDADENYHWPDGTPAYGVDDEWQCHKAVAALAELLKFPHASASP